MTPPADSPPFDVTRYQDPLAIQRVLHNARTIAVVGLSPNELRASYFVGYYLRRHGYTVIPVNPREPEILGERCYPRLVDVPVPIDVVNVFRAPDALPALAEEAVKIGAGCLWCQFGVDGGHGPLSQGRARALRRPDALARVQHASHHVRSRPAAIGMC